MANGSSFASLSRKSKRGSFGTAGTDLPEAGVPIGSVDDTPPGDEPPATMPHAPYRFSGLARRADESPAAPREYEQSQFASLSGHGSGADGTRAARHDVHAVKLVTRLVQGIAYKPGSAAADNIKSHTLREMLLQVHRLSGELAHAVAPEAAHKPWVKAQCAEQLAELIARRNEEDQFGEPLDVERAVQVVSEVMQCAEADDEVAAALDVLRENKYVEAVGDVIANDRVSVSLASATWDLFDKVTSPRLGRGDFRFSYGREPAEVVGALSKHMLLIALEMNIRIASLDMRTAHLQGSIRRVGGLLGAEYVSRTRKVMNWIGEDGIDDAEFDRRNASARSSFDTTILPEIVFFARRSFIAIEQLAPRLLEETQHEQQESPRPNGS
jgi:hypothetical protein